MGQNYSQIILKSEICIRSYSNYPRKLTYDKTLIYEILYIFIIKLNKYNIMSSVLIKDVDKQLYSQFKAEAALRGIKIGDALQLAMKKWLDDQKSNTEIESQRIKNNALFRQLLPDLLDEHQGKWVLISDGQLYGVYPTKPEAMEAIKENQLTSSHNLVSPITDEKRTVRLGFGKVIS